MEELLNLVSKWLGEGKLENILLIAGSVYAVLIAIANLITMLLPSVKDSKIYNAIMKVLNFIALNILKNKNADEKKS